MPQASAELRAKMRKRFGSISDVEPWKYLASRGYDALRCVIRPPPGHRVTEDEGECIDFLVDEWDWDYRP